MNKTIFLKIFLLGFAVSFLVNNDLYASDEFILSISAPELKYMMNKTKVIVINSMSRIEFDRQHILDSISIPLSDMSISKDLPQDRDIPLVFYCMGKQ